MTETFDDMAALIREAEGDRVRFLERFAALCAESLPQQTTVVRQKQGWLGRTSVISGLELRLSDYIYRLDNSHGTVAATRLHEVRGIVLSRGNLCLSDWISEVMSAIKRLHGSTSGEGEAILRSTAWNSSVPQSGHGK